MIEHEGKGPAEKGNDEDASDDDRRPISVRDLLPGPPARPERRTRTEESQQEGGEEDGEREGADGEDGPAGPRVPTPVRVAMDAEEPEPATRPPEELPSRRFEVDGEEWIVRLTGRTLTGTRPDAGALLMRLGFFPAGPSDESGSATGGDANRLQPTRILITVDRPLDALYDEDLEELFHRSRTVEGEQGVSM